MGLVIVHVPLLLIQFPYRQVHADIPAGERIPLRHVCLQISKVAANMPKLPADLHTDLLCRPLFGLSQCKIGLPGDPPIGPGLLPGMENFVEVVYHPLQLLTGFMEEFEVLRVLDVGWGTGGIQNLCSDV